MPLITITEYLDTPVTKPRAVGQLVTVPWPNLLTHLLSRIGDQRAKGAAGYWVAAPVPGPRSNASAQPTRVVALDWDDAPVDWRALRAYEYFAHTTDSHTESEPRWRVWMLLDREYSAEEVGRAVCPWPGAHLRAISQPAFIPTMGDDVEYDGNPGGHRRGPLVLSTWWPAEAPAPAQPQPRPRAGRLAPSPRAINALVTRWLSNPDGTNRLAGATGACLAEWGWTDAEVEAFLAAWLHADPRLTKHTDDALRGAAKRRAGDRIVGFPTLVAELGGEWAAESADAVDISAVLLEAAGAAEAPRSDSPFKLVSASAAAAYELKSVQWLSEQLVMAPGAPSLITGYGGSGKTTFVQHLALAVATAGGKLLGRHPLRHGPVVHIDHEQGLDLTVRRYRSQGLTGAEQLDFCSFPPWALGDATPASREHFVRLCRGRALVIIDSFLASCAGHIDENSSDTREPLDFLGQVSDATGAVILVIHHSKKDRSEAMTSARGTSAITDAVSLHLTYEKKELTPGELPTLKIGKTRHEPPPGAFVQAVRVAMTPSDAGYTLTEATGPTSAEESADIAVATVLMQAGRDGLASLKAISTAAHLRAINSDAAVRRGVQNGIIVCRNGRYFCTNS